ncbi:MAG: hypothetical protein P1S60_02870, partial [Anaerolineae bacterium]|nr:hypothetical protein [Anaerolineae bacterium]
MANENFQPKEAPIKGVILAAGQHTIRDKQLPMVLQVLDNKCIIDYVIDRALEIVTPDNLTIVVPETQSQVQNHVQNAAP